MPRKASAWPARPRATKTTAVKLAPMMEQARANLGVAAQNPLTVADPGYGAGADLAAATDKEMHVLVPPAAGTPARDHPCAAQHFVDDAGAHTVTWPRGQKLAHEGGTTKQGLRAERFRCPCPTARCAGTARAIPKAGSSKCGRPPRWCRRGGRGCASPASRRSGAAGRKSSHGALPSSNNTRASDAGRSGAWTTCALNGRGSARP